MKIHLSSDLHLEFDENRAPHFPEDADVIVLAGDIWFAYHIADYIRHVAHCYPDSQILFIPGNHEYYHREYHDAQQVMREGLGRIPNAHFLDRDRVTINGVEFLGCTLWTGFDILPDIPTDIAKVEAEAGIADYDLTRIKERYLTAEDTVSLHQESRRWLEGELAKPKGGKRVVITHFPPCLEVQHVDIPVNPLTPYFQANCRDLVEQYKPELWLFGHIHYNHDRTVAETRMVSNQRGYPEETTLYDEKLLIDLTCQIQTGLS